MSKSENPGIRIFAGDPHSLDPVADLHAASFDEAWGQAALADILAMPGAFMLLATGTDVWFDNNDNIPDNNDNIRQPLLLGFVIARIAADEAEILTVAVDISHRGQGLGGKLMEAAAAHARALGAASLFLEVAADNMAALALYARLGFVEVGLRPNYYARGMLRVAARTMRLDLSKTSVLKRL